MLILRSAIRSDASSTRVFRKRGDSAAPLQPCPRSLGGDSLWTVLRHKVSFLVLWTSRPVERRLAAILAADVVGYSRFMETDEAGALAALTARRKEVFEPLLARYRGRIVKLMGDGVLAEFASAVNAVECAVALQQSM